MKCVSKEHYVFQSAGEKKAIIIGALVFARIQYPIIRNISYLYMFVLIKTIVDYCKNPTKNLIKKVYAAACFLKLISETLLTGVNNDLRK